MKEFRISPIDEPEGFKERTMTQYSIRVRVEPRHIEASEGRLMSPLSCPIAQVLREMMPDDFISVGGSSFTIGAFDNRKEYEMPQAAIDWLVTSSETGVIEPIEFTATLVSVGPRAVVQFIEESE